jgi:hypothetical protein
MPDPGYRSPLVDFFFRGEVARDIRLLAARGVLAPAPLEQLALLVLLSDDQDAEIAATALATLAGIPEGAVAGFLGRAGVTPEMRAFFAARGVQPAAVAAPDDDEPLVPVPAEGPELSADADEQHRALSALSVTGRIKLAMRGTREQRATLIRDSNRLVAAAVLSSPKLTDSEVERFARMANVSEEVLRIIGTNRNWIKNYSIFSSLVRNPKTPPALSLRFVQRLVEKDLKLVTMDRNVPELLRLAARKLLTKSKHG